MAKSRRKTLWVYDPRGRRWRHGGKWSRPPRGSELRRDRAGRYLDDTGRRVPRDAVRTRGAKPDTQGRRPKPRTPAPAPKRPAKKKAKKPSFAEYAAKQFAWDGQRWRRGGRFVSPPEATQLLRDDQGHIIDVTGRRIPPEALKGWTPPRARRREIQQISASKPVVEKEYFSSSWKNKTSPKKADEVLSETIESAARKGPFAPSDIVIYNHGIRFVGFDRLDDDTKSQLATLIPPQGEIKYADTRLGTEVHVFLDSAPKVLAQAQAEMKAQKSRFLAIWHLLLDYWGSIDWYVWAETDEALYG